MQFPKTHDLKLLLDLLTERSVPTEGLEDFVDLNAFAVQYRYESLYSDEEPLDRGAVIETVSSLLVRVADALES